MERGGKTGELADLARQGRLAGLRDGSWVRKERGVG